MRKSTQFFVAILFLLIAGPQAAFANAKMQLYPTRIVLKEGDNSAEINVVNGGVATGRYRATLADMEMPEQGALRKLEDDTLPHSAKSFIRLSPRSVTVPPGQSQKFRMLVRMPRDLPDGEYRTHLHVLMSSQNVERDAQKTDQEEAGFGVRMQPRFRVSVPIVIVRGDTSFNMSIDDIRYEAAANPNVKPQLHFQFSNEGNRSAWGDLVVTLTKNGETHEIYRSNGYSIYRGTATRRHQVGLEIPEGVSVNGGVIRATFSHPKTRKGGGEVISTRELAL